MATESLFNPDHLYRLLQGLGVTLEIAVLAMIFTLIFGTLFGVVMSRARGWLKVLCRFYLEALRLIPILVWLFVFYFGLARILHIHLSNIAVAVLVFSLWGIAEMGDLVRGALSSISKHQREAGEAIGLSDAQVFRYILLPQSLRRVTPGVINLLTRMIKTTSLAMLIGAMEIVKVGQQIIEVALLSEPNAPFWIYGFIFIVYFLICTPLTWFAARLEKRNPV